MKTRAIYFREHSDRRILEDFGHPASFANVRKSLVGFRRNFVSAEADIIVRYCLLESSIEALVPEKRWSSGRRVCLRLYVLTIRDSLANAMILGFESYQSSHPVQIKSRAKSSDKSIVKHNQLKARFFVTSTFRNSTDSEST